MKKRLLIALISLMLTIIAQATTAFAAYQPANTYLYQGMQSSGVMDLQKDLKRLGYYSSPVDGIFGYYTNQAVRNYQSDNYLAVDGIVGPQTSKELKIDMIVLTAKQYTGVPYVWGGTSPSGFDCSGYVQYVFAQNGITLPRTAAQQFEEGTWVSRNNLKAGDLVFFSTYSSGASHVGIYIGNNKFINAGTSTGVIVYDLNNSYYGPRYIGAKRVI